MQKVTQTGDGGVTITQAVVIVIVAILVVAGGGYFVGSKFFWDQYDVAPLYERQIESLEGMIEKDPKNVALKVALFDKLLGSGDLKQAELTLAGLEKELKNNPDIQYRKAVLAWEMGNKDEVVRILPEVIGKRQMFVAARVLYAEGLAYQKKYEEALGAIDFALRIEPSAADVIVKKAQILKDMGKKDEAKELLQKALKLVPDYQDALDLKKQLQ